MGKRPKNTSKTKCDWQTLTAPPHRRGKLILRDSARKRSITKPPLRERGRGTAKRWWGRKGIAACGIETEYFAAIAIHRGGCTTHKAACGIETIPKYSHKNSAPSCTTHKAACGIETRAYCVDCCVPCRCTTHKAACGMGAPIGSLRSPLTDLSEKQAHRAQLNGKQVVWENVPRTRVKRSVIGRR